MKNVYLISTIIFLSVIMVLFISGCSAGDNISLSDTDYKYIDSIFNNKQLWESDTSDTYRLSCTNCGITKINGKLYFCTYYKYSNGVNGTIGENGGKISSTIGSSKYLELTESGLSKPTDTLSKEDLKSVSVVSNYQEYNSNATDEQKKEQVKQAYMMFFKKYS